MKKLGAIFVVVGALGLATWYFWGEFYPGRLDKTETGNSGDASRVEDVIDGREVALPNLDRVVFSEQVKPEEQARMRPEIKEIAAALKQDPALYDSWLDLASYRKLAGDFTGAEEIWLYMAANWPNDRIAYENLGDLYHLYIRDYPRAERYYRAALDRDDTYAGLYLKFHELYALSWKKKGHLADDILLEGLEKIPGHVGLLFSLAEYYAKTGDVARAQGHYRQVRALAVEAGDTKTVERVDEAVRELE